MRRFFPIVIFALILSVCVSFAAHGEKILRLGIYTGGRWDVPINDSDRFFDSVIEEFERRYPDTSVVYESGVFREDYSDWLADRVMNGDLPDVFLIQQGDLYYLSQIGALEELSGYMAHDAGFDRDMFFGSTLEEGKVNNGQFALAYEIVPTLMLVNTTLLREAGIDIPAKNWTIDDFFDICSRVTDDTDGDGRLDRFGVFDYGWKDAVNNFGLKLFNVEGTEGYFNQPDMTRVVSFMRSLAEINAGQVPTSQDFDSGRVAFRSYVFSSYKAYKPYPYRLKRYMNFEWDCLPMPCLDNTTQGTTVIQSALIGMSARSRYKGSAWDFIKLMITDEGIQKSLVDYSYGIPVLRSILDDDGDIGLLPSDEMLNPQTLKEILDKAVSEPVFKSYDDVMEIADREITSLIASLTDTDRALLDLNNKVNAVLNP